MPNVNQNIPQKTTGGIPTTDLDMGKVQFKQKNQQQAGGKLNEENQELPEDKSDCGCS